MFYYPAVLNHRTGCFSTIWLVATKGIRVPRREYLKVNIMKTCYDIMKYVQERMAPPQPGLPRPRFSLYLSSQLQYGVIVVYHRQCSILLEELQSVVVQLLKQRTSQKIDLDDHSRQAQVLPDVLALMEDAEGAPDPLFGVMHWQETLPSPSTLIQMNWERMRDASPEPPVAAAAQENGITAHPDTITLRELAPVSTHENVIWCEMEGSTELSIDTPGIDSHTHTFEDIELDDHFQDTLDILLAQPDHFPEGDVEIPREQVTPEREERRRGEIPGSSIEVQPTTVLSEDALLLPQEMGPLVEEPRPPSGQLTPVRMPHLLSPPPAVKKRPESHESEDVAPPEVRRKRRRRRQLTYLDQETQLSQEELQQQIDDPLIETSRPVPVPPLFHKTNELFINPCSYLPEEILFLWRQAAVLTPVSGSDLLAGQRGPASTDSEREREEETEVPETEEGRREMVPSDVAESEMFDISAPVTLPPQDQGELSRGISPVPISDIEGSSISSRTKLEVIPEVEHEPVITELSEHPLGLSELTEDMLFHSLLPPEADRRSISSIFMRLLENLTAKKLRAVQDQPYGDIRISPGPEGEDMPLSL